MDIKFALILAALIQCIAFAVTIGLIPRTNYKIAWISISVGFLFMAIRRITEAFFILKQYNTNQLSLLNSWMAIVISISMLVSAIYIRKIFIENNKIQALNKRNDARLLKTIISTEEKERKNFASELHDGLGPILSAAKMILSAIDKKKLEAKPVKLIEKAETLVDNAIVATKEISNRLTPNLINNFGLKKAIETFIKNTKQNDKIHINFTSNIDKNRYNSDIEVIIYRIFCELMINTMKHANATKINALLIEDNRMLKLKYDDNGVGFNIEKASSNGMGLSNINSRLRSLDGQLEMKSNKDKGFYISIQIPL